MASNQLGFADDDISRASWNPLSGDSEDKEIPLIVGSRTR
jgi:hypothetical protein